MAKNKIDDIKIEELECKEHHHHEHQQHEAAMQMPTDVEVYEMADLFKMFADPTRVRILKSLAKGELCVCDIAELLGMEQSAISHQLRVLKQSKLVNNKREGKTVFYSLADEHIYSILMMGLEHIRE